MTRNKYPPGGAIIRSIANQTLGWKLALCEWLDNSFDAAKNKDVRLTEIRILIGTKHVMVRDNSMGHDKLSSMVQIGAHDQHSTTQIGEYGIGAKDAALWIGGENSVVLIESTCRGVKRTLSVDWADRMVATSSSYGLPKSSSQRASG